MSEKTPELLSSDVLHKHWRKLCKNSSFRILLLFFLKKIINTENVSNSPTDRDNTFGPNLLNNLTPQGALRTLWMLRFDFWTSNRWASARGGGGRNQQFQWAGKINQSTHSINQATWRSGGKSLGVAGWWGGQGWEPPHVYPLRWLTSPGCRDCFRASGRWSWGMYRAGGGALG